MITWEAVDAAFTEKLAALDFVKSEVLAPSEQAVQHWNERYMLIPKGTALQRRPSVNRSVDTVLTLDFIYRERLTIQDRAEKVRVAVDRHLATLPSLMSSAWWRTEAEFLNLTFAGQQTALGGGEVPLYVESVITFEIADRWSVD